MMQQRISIIGAGAGGFALAADFESRGIQTIIYSHPFHLKNAVEVTNRRHRLKGFVPRITCDMMELVDFSTLVFITVPSTGQATILKELRRFDLTLHTLVSIPGNLISLLAPELHILEANLSPYSCRLNNGELVVLGRKKLFYISGPRDERIDALFNVKWCHNVLEVCLANINGVFHPIMQLLSAGRIGTDFLLYREGLNEPCARAMKAIDDVRLRIGDAFGFKLKTVLETSNECYGQNFTSLVDLGRYSPPHNNLKAPLEMEHRNISEDVPELLVCWYELAVKLGIDASSIKAVITMAEMTTGKDYSTDGRTLSSLGLGKYSRTDLLRRFEVQTV